jgi:hypothetical protein
VTTSLSRDAFQAALDAATADLSPAERVAVAERVATAVARTARRTRYPSPGVLAHKLDPLTTRETPFLRCLDEELVAATRAMEAGQGARHGGPARDHPARGLHLQDPLRPGWAQRGPTRAGHERRLVR